MWLDGDGDGADFGHGVLGRIFRIFGDDAFSLVRLGPILFEKTFADPFLTRS